MIYLGAELAKFLCSVPYAVNALSYSHLCCERPRIREYAPEDNLVRSSKYVMVATHIYEIV